MMDDRVVPIAEAFHTIKRRRLKVAYTARDIEQAKEQMDAEIRVVKRVQHAELQAIEQRYMTRIGEMVKAVFGTQEGE